MRPLFDPVPLVPATPDHPLRVELWPDWDWWHTANGTLHARHHTGRTVQAHNHRTLLTRIRNAEGDMDGGRA